MQIYVGALRVIIFSFKYGLKKLLMFTFILFHLRMCDVKLTNKYLVISTIFKHCVIATQGTPQYYKNICILKVKQCISLRSYVFVIVLLLLYMYQFICILICEGSYYN